MANPIFSASVTRRLDPTPTGNYLSIFSNYSPTDDTSVYNTNLWGGLAYDLVPALTGICWTESGTGSGRGVAITKRHILVGEHGTLTTSSTGTWILADGTRVQRVFADAVTSIGSATAAQYYFRMMYLSADLPDTVPLTPLLVPAPDGVMNLLGVPVVKLDADEKLLVAVPVEAGFTDNLLLTTGVPTNAVQEDYHELSVGGDSGSATFAVFGKKLIYLTTIQAADSELEIAAGPYAPWLVPEILAAVESLNTEHSGTYTPTLINPGQLAAGGLDLSASTLSL